MEIKVLNDGEVNLTKQIENYISCDNKDYRDESFYVCDVGNILEKYYLWLEKLPRVDIFYAIKCNNHDTILRLFASLNVGFDCASKHEIQKMLNFGAASEKIVFSQAAKCISHMNYANTNNVNLVTFDSYDEIIKTKRYMPNARMLLRIKCAVIKCVRPLSKKFGCDVDTEARTLIRQTRDAGLDFVGIMFHVGCGCLEPEVYDDALRISRELIDYAHELGFKCSIVNMGGGFLGEQNVRELFLEIANIINRAIDKYFSDLPDIRFIAEPGRYFITESVKFTANIHSKRVLYTENGDVNEIMYFLSDGAYGPFHPKIYKENPDDITLLRPANDPVKTYNSSLWGPTCDSFDFIYKKITLPELNVEDWLVFNYMGSYTYVAACEFNSFPKANIKFYITQSEWDKIKDNFVRTIKKDASI